LVFLCTPDALTHEVNRVENCKFDIRYYLCASTLPLTCFGF